jgi:hypothetical protein
MDDDEQKEIDAKAGMRFVLIYQMKLFTMWLMKKKHRHFETN